MEAKCPKCGQTVKKVIISMNNSAVVIPVEIEETIIVNDVGELITGHVPHYLVCQGVEKNGFA